MLVEGGIADTTAAAYSFNVAPVSDSDSVAGRGCHRQRQPGGAGEAGSLHLQPGGSLLLYFDSLTNSSNLHWSLSGPAGTAVSNRAFTASDASSISGNPVLSLPAGAYTLTVSASGADHRRLTRFRLLDLSQATALTPGTPVSGTFSPANGTTAYRFNATAGDSDYFARLSGSGSDYWRLDRPVRQPSLRHGLSTDGGRITLTATGTYTVLVEGGVADTTAASYSFNVVPVTDPPHPLSLGATVSASLAAPAEQDRYTFNLAALSLLYFDSLTNNSNLRWSLAGPGGTLVSNRAFTASDGSEHLRQPGAVLASGRLHADGLGVWGDHRGVLLPAARPVAGDGA